MKAICHRQLSIIKLNYTGANKQPETVFVDVDLFSPEELFCISNILRNHAMLAMQQRAELLKGFNTRSNNYVA